MRRITLKHIEVPSFNPAMPYKRKITVHVYRRVFEFDRMKDATEFLSRANEASNNLIYDMLKLCANVYEVYRYAHYSGMDPLNLAPIEFHANLIFKDLPDPKLHYYPFSHVYKLRDELSDILDTIGDWWEARKNYDNLKQAMAIKRNMDGLFKAFEQLA